MVVRVPLRISDKRDIEVDGKAYADAPADSDQTAGGVAASVQTAGGVYTLVLDVDDPEDMLGSALEDWEAEHGGQDNAP